jgi:threonine dehydrogenase-like Zn-dependent dehydrogenase
MRAVVRRNKALVCDEVADPVPGPGQVLVKTLCCGICGSDLHALHAFEHMLELGARTGSPMSVDPANDIVFGHEFSAEVLDHGPETTGALKAGTRVVSMPIAIGPGGFETVGYSNRYPGGFGERMVLTEAMLLPGAQRAGRGARGADRAVRGWRARVAQSSAGPDTVNLVIGCGPGRAGGDRRAEGSGARAGDRGRLLAGAAARGRADGRGRGGRSGAGVPYARWSDYGVLATSAERFAAQMAGREGKRAIVFECVGVPGLLQAVMEGAPIGAQMVVAGVCMAPDTIEPFVGINKQLELRFVLGYTPEEFAGTLGHIAEGRIDVAPVVTGTVGLDGVADAFVALGDPEQQCKVMVRP